MEQINLLHRTILAKERVTGNWVIHILLSVVYVGPFSETKLQIVDSPLYDKYPTSLFTGMKEIFEGAVSLLCPPLCLSENVRYLTYICAPLTKIFDD